MIPSLIHGGGKQRLWACLRRKKKIYQIKNAERCYGDYLRVTKQLQGALYHFKNQSEAFFHYNLSENICMIIQMEYFIIRY